MKKNLALFLKLAVMVMLLVGCSSLAYKFPVERELVKSYSLGTTYYTKIGDSMMSFQYGKAYMMFEATETCYSDDSRWPGIMKGDVWVAWFGDSDGIIIMKKGSKLNAYKGWHYGYGLKLDNSYVLTEKPFVEVYINTPHLYTAGFTEYKKNTKLWPKDRFEVFKLLDKKYYAGEDLLKSELLYNGREKDTVFLLYREYTGEGIARSPFYQQLRYDVKESSIINYKSLRIEVLNATNEGITFKVISDEDVQWMRAAK